MARFDERLQAGPLGGGQPQRFTLDRSGRGSGLLWCQGNRQAYLFEGGGKHNVAVAQTPVPELRVRHVLTQRRQTPAVRSAHDKRAGAVILPRSGFHKHSYLEINRVAR
jgi:hypothetical protein